MSPAEALAKRFHEIYESLAHLHAYETRKESAVEWELVPDNNKRLMIATCAAIVASPEIDELVKGRIEAHNVHVKLFLEELSEYMLGPDTPHAAKPADFIEAAKLHREKAAEQQSQIAELSRDKTRLDRLDATLQAGFHWGVRSRGGAWQVLQIIQFTPEKALKRTVRDALDNAMEHEPTP